MDWAVREAVLKEDPIASQLNLRFAGSNRTRAIKIKLEIDTNPPAGSGEATTFLDFPADYEVRRQDLPSNFALKVRALLRSEEHTSDLQSLMRIPYAVFCLKKQQ